MSLENETAAPIKSMNWFTMDATEVEKELKTSLSNGLFSADAKTRLDTYGYNELEAGTSRPRWKVFLDQFKDILI